MFTEDVIIKLNTLHTNHTHIIPISLSSSFIPVPTDRVLLSPTTRDHELRSLSCNNRTSNILDEERLSSLTTPTDDRPSMTATELRRGKVNLGRLS